MDSTPAFATQLHPSRLRAAMATPSSWVDAVIESVDDASGTAELVLRELDGAAYRIRAEHLSVNDNGVQPGEPVALHPVFGVLAVGGRFFRAA